MDLRRGFDKVLQMRPSQKVPQRHEFAVIFVLDVDDAPSVLPASYGSSAHDYGFLRSDDSKRDEVLDLCVHGALFFILLVVVVGVHSEVVESKFLLDALFEFHAFFER